MASSQVTSSASSSLQVTPDGGPESPARVLRAVARSHGDRLRLKAGGAARPVAASPPLVLEGRDGGRLIAFRFGASVSIGLGAEEEARLLAEIEKLVEVPHQRPGREEAEVCLGDGEEGVDPEGRIVVSSLGPKRLEVVSSVLAKSAVLDYHENRVAGVFETIEPLARRLRDASLPRSRKQILQQLGNALLVQTATIGRVEVTEKPEVTWQSVMADRLYVRLAKEFELAERDQALDRKLQLIATVANAYLDLLHNRQSMRVEWYIVILIVIEIVLSVYSLFFG